MTDLIGYGRSVVQVLDHTQISLVPKTIMEVCDIRHPFLIGLARCEFAIQDVVLDVDIAGLRTVAVRPADKGPQVELDHQTADPFAIVLLLELAVDERGDPSIAQNPLMLVEHLFDLREEPFIFYLLVSRRMVQPFVVTGSRDAEQLAKQLDRYLRLIMVIMDRLEPM